MCKRQLPNILIMKDFDLRKYLAEGKLLKEEIMVDPIIMFGGKEFIEGVIKEPDDYGHFPEDAEWIKNNINPYTKANSIVTEILCANGNCPIF